MGEDADEEEYKEDIPEGCVGVEEILNSDGG